MFKRIRVWLTKRRIKKAVGSCDELGLIAATQNGEVRILKAMFEMGFEPNVRDGRGRPLLSLAIESGNIQSLRALVEQGADLDTQDQEGLSPLMYCIETGNKHLFHYFLDQHPALDLIDHKGDAAIHKAARAGQTSMLSDLVKAGAELDMTNGEGKTALYIAVEQMRVGMTRVLLQAGADPNLADKAGRRVMDLDYLSTRMVRILREAGAQPGSRSGRNFNPTPGSLLSLPIQTLGSVMDEALHTLDSEGRLDTMEEKGRQVLNGLRSRSNGQQKEAANPAGLGDDLRWLVAVLRSFRDIGRQLGGMVAHSDEETWSSLKSIQQEIALGLDEFSAFLGKRHGEEDPKKSSVPTGHPHQERLDAALREASASGSVKLVQVLLDLGANPDNRDKKGNAALHHALPHHDVINMLVRAGADPERRNLKGQRPVDLALDMGLEPALVLGGKPSSNGHSMNGHS